jgi:hypothetical protein
MHLHGAVGGFAAQAVGPKITHRHPVGERVLDLRLRELVHLPCGLADQQPEHLGLRRQFDQRPLDRLVLGQRLAERLSLARVFYAFVDAIDRSPQRTRRLPDAVLVHKTLRQRQAAADLAEQRIVGHEHIREADTRMIRRHVEGPHIFLDLDARALGRHQQASNTPRVTIIAGCAGKQRAMGGDMHTRGPHLLAVDDPAFHVVAGRRHGPGFHMRRVGTVIGFGEAKRDAVFSGDRAFDHRLLIVGAVAVEHGDDGQIADDRMLVLQIVVQAETFRREMLADHGHPEIGTVLAAIALRNREPQVTGGVGEIFGLAQQRFPFVPRQAAIVEIGARPFAAVIEEADVVVGLLQRLDLAHDEAIEFVEIRCEVGRQVEIQGGLSRKYRLFLVCV